MQPAAARAWSRPGLARGPGLVAIGGLVPAAFDQGSQDHRIRRREACTGSNNRRLVHQGAAEQVALLEDVVILERMLAVLRADIEATPAPSVVGHHLHRRAIEAL